MRHIQIILRSHSKNSIQMFASLLFLPPCWGHSNIDHVACITHSHWSYRASNPSAETTAVDKYCFPYFLKKLKTCSYESERCFTISNGILEASLSSFNGKGDGCSVFFIRGIVICLWVAVCRWVILVKLESCDPKWVFMQPSSFARWCV